MSPQADNPALVFRDLGAVERYLDGRVNLERIVAGRAGRMSLEPMKKLLVAVGNPQRSFRSIHVGGTVGKGSTARFLASMLSARGCKTGLYTSPHLQRMSERIVVGDEEIGERSFCEAMAELAPHADAAGASYFDLLTAAAFLHFRREAAEWAVVEVGLGGRLDSTNAIEPELCVITNVGSDHADVLGATVAQRAREKAGIVKPGAPLVTDACDPAALVVLEEACAEKGVAMHRLPAATPAEPRALPEFQRRNLVLARFAFDALAERLHWPRATDKEVETASHAPLPGRCEIYKGDPRIVLDGAHMPEAIEALLASLRERPRPRIVLFGAAADKDAAGMLKLLARWADRGIMCAADSPRARNASELLAMARASGLDSESAQTMEQALTLGREAARGGTLLATGSLYLVGEIRSKLAETR